ncbi:MAG: glycerophosphodiester phosphodiesterase [Candidatus Hydrogenedentes bacterium]|nr:glycerophosphodiester phosphodiesterase [Candidatus Hydrogenedentota bacterium]
MRFYATLCAAVLAFAAAASAQSPAHKPFFSKQILLGAHRGGASQWPENTLYCFQEVLKAHPDVLLETDARLTSDGAVVLMHDKTVDRTTNGTGEVSTMSLAQVKALDAGHKFSTDNGATFPHRGKGLTIPTLKEVLDALPGSHVLVELKGEPALADAAIAVIRDAKAEDRVLLASFVPPTMDRARELAPSMAYCYDMKTGTSLLMALRGPKWADYLPQADVLSIDQGMIARYNMTSEEIKRMQEKGIRFQVHTINDPHRMREFVMQGVDSILTDNPSELAAVIAESRTATK